MLELISPLITKFTGERSVDAENWIKSMVQFTVMNSLCLSGAFDLFLTDGAKDLWEFYKDESGKLDNQSVEDWFRLKFTKQRKILELISDVFNISQKKDEMFEVFELRVKKTVHKLFDGSIAEEDLVKEIIAKRINSEKIKEECAMDPDLTVSEIKKKAINLAVSYTHLTLPTNREV